MQLFKISKNQLAHVKEEPFKLEKEIQALTEENLAEVFELTFVKSEFRLQNFRIDTLAFDENSNSFVIIEYKRDKNFSVIDQGYAYLSLMLNNKAEFILEYNEKFKSPLKREQVDWSQSKVIFVAPSFTTYQKEAVNFKDLPIELCEVKRYQNQTVSYSFIKSSGAQESIKALGSKNDVIGKVEEQIKVYTEDDHTLNASDEIKELYYKLKSSIESLEDFTIRYRKQYIAFALQRNIVGVRIQKKNLKIWINLKKGELDDPKNISRDVSSIGHYGSGGYEIVINSDEDLEYIISLVKQSIKKNR